MNAILSVCIIIITIAVIIITVFLTLTLIQVKRITKKVHHSLDNIEVVSSKLSDITKSLTSPLAKLLMLGVTMASYGLRKKKKKKEEK